jgi:hypothetical protein
MLVSDGISHSRVHRQSFLGMVRARLLRRSAVVAVTSLTDARELAVRANDR